MKFYQVLLETALANGFEAAGALDLESASSQLSNHHELFRNWLDQGFAGKMEYLHRGSERRSDPKKVMPDAQSILCVAVPYRATALGQNDTQKGPRYARYLRGDDYHTSLKVRLENTMQSVKSKCEAEGLPIPKWKICVDTSAILERSWAYFAGLGWIGKNTMLIHPKLGSFLLLGEVLIDQPVGAEVKKSLDYCGSCTRCIDACPTGAFPEPHTLDSNKCISYWTLEKRGSLDISDAEKKAMGTWVAGCDICQEACPFNWKPIRNAQEPDRSVDTATELDTWDLLLGESNEKYLERVKNSSLNRVKPAQFRRNLAIALRNAWAVKKTSELDVLQGEVQRQSEMEIDPSANSEWKNTLKLFKSGTPEEVE